MTVRGKEADVCTYLTERIPVDGSGKGGSGWFPLRTATVYVDHPQHAPHEHTVNIDFLNPSLGPAARVAVELTEEAALALADAIRAAIASAPPGLASAATGTGTGTGRPAGTGTGSGGPARGTGGGAGPTAGPG